MSLDGFYSPYDPRKPCHQRYRMNNRIDHIIPEMLSTRGTLDVVQDSSPVRRKVRLVEEPITSIVSQADTSDDVSREGSQSMIETNDRTRPSQSAQTRLEVRSDLGDDGLEPRDAHA